MSGLRFGLRCPPCGPATEVAAFAREAERAGFDMAWIPDSQFLWRDVWATIALVATSTERIGIGTAVTNFETREVAVTAGAAATIEELAPGRFRLGVGTGDSAVKTLGRAPTRIQPMRERIERLRALVRGKVVTYAGAGAFRDRRVRVRHAPGRDVPVYMAASGPRALALAGEVADGVIVHSGVAPPLVERALGHLAHGAERAGRRLEDLDVWLAAHAAITTDEPAAARLVKPLCLSSAQLGAGDALRSLGIELDVPPVVEGVYPDVTHAEDWEAAIAAAERHVDDEAADRYARSFTLAGPPELVAERIAAAARLGISSFYLLGLSSYELPRGLLEAFGAGVLPRVRS